MTERGASVGSSDTMKDQEKLSKDAQVISSILKDVGIEEWDPRVLQQMMEYSYRWLRSIITKLFAPKLFQVCD